MSDAGIGLRELKKQMTRESIANTTLHLALRKGLDQITIDEIARDALVSPRTFSNYFSCKEEAAAAAQSPDLSSALSSFASRPAGEPPLAALSRILSDLLRALPPEQLGLNRRKLELARRHPTLQPYLDGQYSAFERSLRLSVAQSLGMDAAVDMYPSLVASAATSALKSAVQLWVNSDSTTDLPLLIEEAFRQIGAGLATPPAPVG